MYMVIDCGKYPFKDIRLIAQAEDYATAFDEYRDQVESYNVRNKQEFCTSKQFKVVLAEVKFERQCDG